MVFPSLPLYLDPPNSWNQPPQAHQPGGCAATSDDQQAPHPAASGGPDPTRAGSMAERARLAKITQPESALSCPRCDSNNTKFCYFNNYSLSQPRHFCKTCRRYWTRGGALRTVPVGGGCRRNKRGGGGKSSSSTSLTSTTTSSSSKLQPNKSSASATATSAPGANTMLLSAAAPPLPLFAAAPWNQMQEYGYGGQLGLEQWRLAPYMMGGMEMAAAAGGPPAAAGMYGYHEGEWSNVGGSNININGSGGGWMNTSSATDHVLGFGGSSSMGNGNL